MNKGRYRRSKVTKTPGQAYLTFFPFSHTLVLLRIPAFSRFCTYNVEDK